MDVGFGFDAVVPHALTSDTETPYTRVGQDKQIFKNDCRNFSFLCDETMSYWHNSHLAEDFSYGDLVNIVKEWRRCLKIGGYLLTNCPDQQRFLRHCSETGQGTNDAHHEQDFSLRTWNERVIAQTGPWEVVMEEPNHGPYSWLQVLKKLP